MKIVAAKGSKSFYNIVLHGEYRNKTRNRLWDIIAKGDFYLNGVNSGDYSAYGALSRYLNKKLGNVRLSFHNVNRSPHLSIPVILPLILAIRLIIKKKILLLSKPRLIIPLSVYLSRIT
ncbi:MAG: hypothetical protein WKI04_02055 [Ferruginibacter sp.]